MRTKKKISQFYVTLELKVSSSINWSVSVFKTEIILKPKLWHRDQLFVVSLGLVPCSDSSNRQTHCNVCRSQTAAGHSSCSIAFQWIHWFLHAAISWYNGKDGASRWCNHELFFFFFYHVLAAKSINAIEFKRSCMTVQNLQVSTNMDMLLFQNQIFSSSFL